MAFRVPFHTTQSGIVALRVPFRTVQGNVALSVPSPLLLVALLVPDNG